MKRLNSIYALILITLPLNVQAQEEVLSTLEVNLADVCEEKLITAPLNLSLNSCEITEKETSVESLAQFSMALDKHQVCNSIDDMIRKGITPINIEVKDDEGKPWKIRFHFGYTRTNYRPTDVNIKSSLMTAKIKGFKFDERNSGKHYRGEGSALSWIDEPSNTMEISIENKNNTFYITAFHPKTLATYYVDKSGDGAPKYTKAGKSEYISSDPYAAMTLIPDGQSAFEIQNTHQLMNYSVGYGRKFNIMNSKKAGELNYIVRVDVGALVGAARTLHFTEAKELSESQDKLGIQSASVALGHRLEYKYKKVGMFIEQKYAKNKIEHSFLDGKASYDLDYSTLNFGVSIDILSTKKKNKKK